MKRYPMKVIVVIALTVPCLFLFRDVLVYSPYKMLFGEDIFKWQYYYAYQIKGLLDHHSFPFWNTYSLSGVPLLAQPAASFIYPLSLIFLIFPINYAFGVFTALHVLMAGFFMYWYGIKRGYDALSATISASVFSLSGYVFANIYVGHLDHITSLVWVPVIIISFEQLFRKSNKKYFILAVVSLTMQIFTGFYQHVMFTLELVFFLFIYHALYGLYTYRMKFLVRFRKNVITVVLAIFLSVGLSAIQLIPAYQLSQASSRSSGLSFDVVANGSFPSYLFKLFIAPYSYGNPFTGNSPYFGPWPNLYEYTNFIGFTPLIIIALYILYEITYSIRKRKINFYLVFTLIMIVFFVFMAMGQYSFLYKLVYRLFPLYKIFRLPTRHMVMVVFLLSAVVGEAMSKLKYPLIKIAAWLLIVVELVKFGSDYIQIKNTPPMHNNQNMVSVVKRSIGPNRLYLRYSPFTRSFDAMDLSGGYLYGIPFINGYNPLLLGNYYHFIELANKTAGSGIYYSSELPLVDSFSPYLNFLNVKYVATYNYSDDIGQDVPGKFKVVYKDGDSSVYENMQYTPRFFIVQNTAVYPDEKSRDDALFSSRLDLSKTVSYTYNEIRKLNINNPDDLEMWKKRFICTPLNVPSVEVADYTDNHIILKTASDCDGFLSTSEVNYPGWKATLDGKTTEVLTSNVAFRSLYLPKGAHEIEFYYDPMIFFIGAAVSLTTLISLVILYRKLKY